MTVLRENFPDAAGSLAAQRNPAVPGLKFTILYHDIFARNVDQSPVMIAPRFDRNTIIPVAETTAFDPDSIA